jgi:octaprenyl-diphosphate synthase
MLETVTSHPPLNKILEPIQSDLDDMEAIIEAAIQSKEELMAEAVNHVRSFRGKRLRPALVFLAGKCFSQDSKTHKDQKLLAGITELIHTCTLIHDDIIDRADTRRNSEAFNAKWDNNVAVIFGDFLFSKAFSMTVQLEDGVLRQRLAEVISDLCEGEMMQLHGRNNSFMDEEFYNSMILLKTATFLGCCTGMGARLAGASDEEVQKMDRAGELLGSAFQIVDDCLDLMGDEGVMGKSLGTDLSTGKFTLPLIKLLEYLSAEEILTIKKHFLDGHGDKAKAFILRRVRETDVIDQAWEEASQNTEEALRIFESLPESEARNSLIQLAQFLIYRSH